MSEIVVLPLSCGVPVIAPVVAFSVAQLGSPVAAQLVTGRFGLSVSAGVPLNAAPTTPDSVCPAAIIGAPAVIVKATLRASLVPPSPVAAKLAVNEPFAVGVPVIAPVVALSDSPAGNPVTLQDVAVRFTSSSRVGVCENATPTFPVKLCPATMIGGPTAIEIVAVVASLVPPGPVAVSEIVVLPLSCGVPVIAPVVVFSVAQLGNPVAAQLVTGRFVLLVSENVLLNATPKAPKAVCDAVMSGTPSVIVKATLLAALAPTPLVAVKLAVNEPFAVGVPVIAPVVVLSDSPAGSPVTLQDVAGRSSASSRVGVAEVNATPTLPAKLCPATMIGGPTAIDIVAVVAALVPPGPVAVSEIVVLPLSCGVPVIAPVVVFSVAQLGKPVAVQLVTGRFALSVSENVLLNAAPKGPTAVCDAVMSGTPSVIVKATFTNGANGWLTPQAVKPTVNEPFAVGVPVIAPVVVLSDSPAGSPVTLQDVAGRSSASSRVGVAEVNATPTLPVKLCPATMIGGPTAMEIVAVAALVPPGPVAVSEIVVLPLSCGVPVIAPVVVLSVAQLGKLVAAQLVTGRFVLSVSENVLLNAVPTVPEAACDAVMRGTPSVIVKATLLAALAPTPLVAVKLAVNEPFAVGVPVIAPVVVLSDSPAGSPVTLQDVAGRSSASSRVGVAEVNATPTLPVKLCPATMIGGPTAMEIVAVAALVPPGPVAVSEIVVLPLSCGVPVIAPVVVLSVAQLGKLVAAQLVTGRYVLTVSENVLLNAVPTVPEAVCPGLMIGWVSTVTSKRATPRYCLLSHGARHTWMI